MKQQNPYYLVLLWIAFLIISISSTQAQSKKPNSFDFDNSAKLIAPKVDSAKPAEVQKVIPVIKNKEEQEDSLVDKADEKNGFEMNKKISLNINEKGKYIFAKNNTSDTSPIKEFDDASEFSEGVAKVSVNNKWGFLDSNLNEVIPLKYDFAWPFKNGAAIVQKNRKYGLINVAGLELTLIDYTSIDFFKKGWAKYAKGNESGFLNKEGKEFEEVIELEDGMFKIRKNGKWGFGDNNGMIIITPIYDDVKAFQNDFATVNKGGRWRYINKRGEELPYDEIFPFIEGFAKVRTKNKYAFVNKYFTEYDSIKMLASNKILVYKNGKYGYVGKNTLELTAPQFDEAGDFYNDFAAVKKDGQFGFVDNSGKLSIPLIYDEAFAFNNNVARVKKNKKYGYIKADGKLVGEIEFTDARDFKEGLALVQINNKYGFINTDGRIKIIPIYIAGNDYTEGFAHVKDTNNKWIYVNKEGAVMPFDEIFPLKDSMALVRKVDKYGFIDSRGKVAIAGIYDNASNFNHGLAYVEIRGKYPVQTSHYYITKKGEQLPYDNAYPFSNGFAKVERKGKIGYINEKGTEIIAPVYMDGGNFENGITMVETLTAKQYLTNTGNVYDNIGSFINKIAIVKRDKKFGLIDSNLKEITPITNDAIYFTEDNTLLMVQNNGVTALYNIMGKTLGFDNVLPFCNGVAVAVKNNAYGFINTAGKEVIPFEYDWADSFRDGKALVSKRGKLLHLNLLGELEK